MSCRLQRGNLWWHGLKANKKSWFLFGDSENVKLPHWLDSIVFDEVIPITKLNTNSMIMADKQHVFKAPRRTLLNAVIILAEQYSANITWWEIKCLLSLPLGGLGSILGHRAWSVSVGAALVKLFRKLHRAVLMWLRHKLSTLPTSSSWLLCLWTTQMSGMCSWRGDVDAVQSSPASLTQSGGNCRE